MGEGTDHEERRAGGNDSTIPLHVFGAFTRQANRNDAPESQSFFDQSRDIRDLLLNQTFFPRVAVGVDLHDLLVCLGLDPLAFFRRQIRDSHDQISGNGVQSRGDHGQTNGFDFSCREQD